MKEVKLSIIVPVYNTNKYITRCLDSLVNQSFKDFEIIIINDGSTDNSNQIINEYISEHMEDAKKIKYIVLPHNMGLGNARNVGIEKSNGEYVTFVDSDDWVDLDLYIKMMHTIIDLNADIAVCGVKNEWDNIMSGEIRHYYEYPNKISGEMAIRVLTKSISNNYFISPVVWNKVYRRDVLTKNNTRFLNNSYWEDDIFSFQILMYTKSVCLIPDVYYHYYQRNSSIMNTISKKHIDDLLNSFLYLKNEIKNTNMSNIGIYFDAMFDRCVCTLIDMIIRNENNYAVQKEYLSYFFNKFVSMFSIEKAIEHLDTDRVTRMFK